VGTRTEIIYGIHPVIEALTAGRRRFEAIYLAETQTAMSSGRRRQLESKAASSGIPVTAIPHSRLRKLTGTGGHQGVAARVGPLPLDPVGELIGKTKATATSRFFLVLDHVVDPQNFGALVRTASCVGVDGIIIAKDRSAPPSPTVSKVSAGALEYLHLSQVTNIVQTIQKLKENGIWVVGLDRDAEETVYSFDFTEPVAIVVGGEQRGIRQLVKRHCDQLCAIPQLGRIDSLNASVAGGVALYEVFRQRMMHHP